MPPMRKVVSHLFLILLLPTIALTSNNNYALILSSSSFFHNYRHTTDATLIYKLLKQNKIPDSNIIFMLAHDHACDSRNVIKNYVAPDDKSSRNLYDEKDVEIDYRGWEVTPETVKRVLLGRTLEGTPLSKQLDLDEDSNVLVYMAGHGGDEFFKFLDSEEIMTEDFGKIFDEMDRLKRYKNLLFMADTCQAFTLANRVDGRGIISVGSSLKNENSYAYGVNQKIGGSAVDRLTRGFTTNLGKINDRGGPYGDKVKLYDTVKSLRFDYLSAHVGIKASADVDLNAVTVDTFFSNTAANAPTITTQKITLTLLKDHQWRGWPRTNFYQWQDEALGADSQKEHEMIQNVGMEPSDPFFIFSVSSLLVAVYFSSKWWG